MAILRLTIQSLHSDILYNLVLYRFPVRILYTNLGWLPSSHQINTFTAFVNSHEYTIFYLAFLSFMLLFNHFLCIFWIYFPVHYVWLWRISIRVKNRSGKRSKWVSHQNMAPIPWMIRVFVVPAPWQWEADTKILLDHIMFLWIFLASQHYYLYLIRSVPCTFY